jgi:hypothetical protein
VSLPLELAAGVDGSSSLASESQAAAFRQSCPRLSSFPSSVLPSFQQHPQQQKVTHKPSIHSWPPWPRSHPHWETPPSPTPPTAVGGRLPPSSQRALDNEVEYLAAWRGTVDESFASIETASTGADDCFELVTNRSGDAESPRPMSLPDCHLLVSLGPQRRVVSPTSSMIQARAIGLTRFADSVCRVGETKSHLAPKLSAECGSRPAALTPGSPGSPSTAPHAPLFTTTTSNASVDAFVNKLKESRSSLDTTRSSVPAASLQVSKASSSTNTTKVSAAPSTAPATPARPRRYVVFHSGPVCL